MKKHTLISALCGALCGILLTATTALAQPGSGGPTPATPTTPTTPTADPTDVPIDGGVSFLLATAGAYGLKRLRRRRA